MQVAEAETPSMTASNNDGDDDFLTLFGAFTVSEKPIPPMSWVEGELAAMDMDNLDQSPQCCRDLQEGYHSDEALLSDMAIDRPPRQGAGVRRSPRNKSAGGVQTPYVNFVADAPELANRLSKARRERKFLRRMGKQSTLAYERLSREIEQLRAIIQPNWRERPHSRRGNNKEHTVQ
ncbi:hypothetical protein V6000_004840 [Aspergillus fumigatus]